MKKNNSFENKQIKKQYIKLIITNFSAFLAVFLIFFFSSIMVVNGVFYRDLEKELEEYTKLSFDPLYNYNRLGIKNARVMAIYYDKQGGITSFYDDVKQEWVKNYSHQLLNYLVPNYDTWEYKNDEDKCFAVVKNSDLCEINDELFKIYEFETVELSDGSIYNFITVSFQLANNPNIPQNPAKYCKLLIMCNPEIASKNNLIQIYLIMGLIVLVVGAFASVLLTSNAIKPIDLSLQKQLSFVSDASHELRTPLAIVQSKLENILTKSDATILDVSEDIAISLNEVQRLNKLTTELLALAKSDNNSAVMNYSFENVGDVLCDTIQAFKEICEINNKVFTINIDEVNSIIDKEKIVQLVMILLDNAIKYTNENDSINITINKKNAEYDIIVSDTGIGISDETKNKMFERFYREDKTRSRERGGTGLGLSIAKTIVLQHKGKITGDHNLPKGTKIIVTLPIRNQK